MSRVIKFRAWDSEDKKMVNVHAIDWHSDTMRPTSINYPHGKLYDAPEAFGGAIKLMQFTGLKDKNGREVYEGDLVEPDGGYEYGECEHPGEVHWNEYNLQWEALCKTCADAVPLAEFDLHSVVGNVWES